MNVIDWIKHTAEWMHHERPDIYPTFAEAFKDLHHYFEAMSARDGSTWTSWGSFMLHKWEEDGVVEWNLMRKITSCDVFVEEATANVYQWTSGSGTIKKGVEALPSPGELPLD